jgi:hypothetical protein
MGVTGVDEFDMRLRQQRLDHVPEVRFAGPVHLRRNRQWHTDPDFDLDGDVETLFSTDPAEGRTTLPRTSPRNRSPGLGDRSSLSSRGVQEVVGEPVEREALRESLCLELKDAIPVFVFTPFGASSLLPQRVGALAEMLVTSAMPVFVCIAGWASVFFPKKVGPFANFLLQANFRF